MKYTTFSTLLSGFIILSLVVQKSAALGPHEIAVIANDASIDSVLIARAYCEQRSVPPSQLVRVEIPEKLYASGNRISQEEFTRLIWEPVNQQLAQRGLSAQVLAWVYSCDFPTRIQGRPEISITGLTFLRNRMPDTNIVDRGTHVSPLFAGPESAEGDLLETQTFDQYRNILLEGMPLPAMMLGYIRERGNSLDELLDMIERGVASDSQFPRGTFYMTATDDVRSMCRHWQFEGAARAIRAAGQQVVITNAFPSQAHMLGFMTGNRTAPPELATYEPGAYTDHLTSFAAAFENAAQTKLSEWIRHGATASSGTVTEPYSIWHKFPNAYIFLHQLKGGTMIESIYQSIRCPLQLLPVGDPLSKPWAPRPRVSVQIPDDPLSGIVEITASCDDTVQFTRFDWVLDGRTVASGRTFLWNSRGVPDGIHTLRAVARGMAPMRHQGFKEVVIEVRNSE